jgi:hypothetical protein
MLSVQPTLGRDDGPLRLLPGSCRDLAQGSARFDDLMSVLAAYELSYAPDTSS